MNSASGVSRKNPKAENECSGVSPRPLNIRRTTLNDLSPEDRTTAEEAIFLILRSYPLWRKGTSIREVGGDLPPRIRYAVRNRLCEWYRPNRQPGGLATARKGSEWFRKMSLRRWAMSRSNPRRVKPKPALTGRERGGRAVLARYGRRYFSRLGKLSGMARRGEQLS